MTPSDTPATAQPLPTKLEILRATCGDQAVQARRAMEWLYLRSQLEGI